MSFLFFFPSSLVEKATSNWLGSLLRNWLFWTSVCPWGKPEWFVPGWLDAIAFSIINNLCPDFSLFNNLKSARSVFKTLNNCLILQQLLDLLLPYILEILGIRIISSNKNMTSTSWWCSHQGRLYTLTQDELCHFGLILGNITMKAVWDNEGLLVLLWIR